jgi:cytochrome c5
VAFKQNDWDKVMTKGFDSVVNNAINGFGNMPAQGSCQECAYQDFEDLVTYMSTAN